MSFIYATLSFHAPAPTDLYTLSLHDALPISDAKRRRDSGELGFYALPDEAETVQAIERFAEGVGQTFSKPLEDRKSTRLNSSHGSISYAVFCLKKKNTKRS